MSQIPVRRSGLIAFAIRMGSTITGLIFVIVVTSNINVTQLGLWTLLLSLVNYVVFASTFIGFWTTRQRARGLPNVGKSSLALALVFASILTLVFLVISVPISISVKSTLFYFLIGSPQVPLLVVAGVLEAILVATNPVRWSLGFGLFEIAKVVIGFVLVAVLRLSLEGAIVAIILAQFVQFITVLIFTRREFHGVVSRELIERTLRGAWVAILSNIPSFIIGFDDLVIAALIGSTLPLGYFTAATTFSSVSLYSSYVAAGLYPSILAGREPSKSTSQILEIQLMLLAPVVIGTILLSQKLLNILQASSQVYTHASIVLIVLVFSAAFFSLGPTLEGVIMGSDRTDIGEKVEQRAFLGSRLVLLSKINISVGLSYLLSVIAIGIIFRALISAPGAVDFSLGLQIAFYWAIANVGSAVAMFLLKLYYVRKIARITISRDVIYSVGVSSVIYIIALVFLAPHIPLLKTEISQTVYIFAYGLIALLIYAGVLITIGKTARHIVHSAFEGIIKR